MKIAIGSDHGGYTLKEELASYLRTQGHDVHDLGTHSTDACDYPDYAFLVAAAVAEGQCELGVMIDGAGIGSAMVANKVPGIRAGITNDVAAASNARQHNKANVVTLGAKVVTPSLAKEILNTVLKTAFEERHQGRIDKITRLEQRFLASATEHRGRR